MDAVSEMAQRIDLALEAPAAELLREYFDPAGLFAGELFDTLGENHPYEITSDDLLALTTLDVRLRPSALRDLLQRRAGEAERLLREVPPDLDLWDATDEHLASAEDLWNFFDSLTGVDWVIAGKLGARKRPRLIPVLDSVTFPLLGAQQGEVWKTLRACLSDEARRKAINGIRAGGVSPSVSVLRLLDAVLWMRGSEADNARQVRSRHGLPVAPRPTRLAPG
jgi:hypothetical protein